MVLEFGEFQFTLPCFLSCGADAKLKETVQRFIPTLVDDIRDEYLSVEQNHPWIIGFSGGKDSTLMRCKPFAALMDISPSRLKRKGHVVSNDTLVESPLVVSHLKQSRHGRSKTVKPSTICRSRLPSLRPMTLRPSGCC